MKRLRKEGERQRERKPDWIGKDRRSSYTWDRRQLELPFDDEA
jgi:hypothetical protein